MPCESTPGPNEEYDVLFTGAGAVQVFWNAGNREWVGLRGEFTDFWYGDVGMLTRPPVEFSLERQTNGVRSKKFHRGMSLGRLFEVEVVVPHEADSAEGPIESPYQEGRPNIEAISIDMLAP